MKTIATINFKGGVGKTTLLSFMIALISISPASAVMCGSADIPLALLSPWRIIVESSSVDFYCFYPVGLPYADPPCADCGMVPTTFSKTYLIFDSNAISGRIVPCPENTADICVSSSGLYKYKQSSLSDVPAFTYDCGDGHLFSQVLTVTSTANYIPQQGCLNQTYTDYYFGYKKYCIPPLCTPPHVPNADCQCVCPQVICDEGFEFDASTCSCIPINRCPIQSCPTGYYLENPGTEQCQCVLDPLCAGIQCPDHYTLNTNLCTCEYADPCTPETTNKILRISATSPIIPRNSGLIGGRVLTHSGVNLLLANPNEACGDVGLTLQSNRGSIDSITQPVAIINGAANARVETRDQLTIAGVSTITSNTPNVITEQPAIITWLPAKYETKFNTTCYSTELESDYPNSPYKAANTWKWCKGVKPPTKKYREKFMARVEFQGSGVAVGGEVVQYEPNNACYYISSCPLTASGQCAQVGVTIALDRTIIPFRGTVDIETIGTRKALDTGGLIKGYHIDVYNGVGKATCNVTWSRSYNTINFLRY